MLPWSPWNSSQVWASKGRIGYKPHPCKVVESRILHNVSTALPPPNLQASLEPCLQNGAVSSFQWESAAVLRASLQDAGVFFLGDATGVGKTRTALLGVYSVAIDCYANNAPSKCYWISTKASLEKQLRAELGLIADSCDDLDTLDVAFMSYAQLRKTEILHDVVQAVHDTTARGGKVIIVFDEAHVCKNTSSKTARAVEFLQSAASSAAVVYCTATPASDVHKIGYMSRLRLWGDGTSFSSFANFAKTLRAAGASAMEMLAVSLKRKGMYLSRSLANDGVALNKLVCELTKEQANAYNVIAMTLRGTMSRHAARWLMSLGAPQARSCLRNVLTSFKVSHLIRSVRADLAAGKTAVIGVQRTGDYCKVLDVKRDGCTASFRVPIAHRQFMHVQHAPQFHLDADVVLADDGGAAASADGASEEDSSDDAESKHLFLFPQNALDAIIEAFGADQVAEMTGRSWRYELTKPSADVQAASGNAWVWDAESNEYSATQGTYRKVRVPKLADEQAAFFSGQKRVAIISPAGSTGFSLHSTCAESTRAHYVFEVPWTAEALVQQCGRTHRANEHSPPAYIVMLSSALSESRMLNAISKRLQTLGALTHGDASSGWTVQADAQLQDDPFELYPKETFTSASFELMIHLLLKWCSNRANVEGVKEFDMLKSFLQARRDKVCAGITDGRLWALDQVTPPNFVIKAAEEVRFTHANFREFRHKPALAEAYLLGAAIWMRKVQVRSARKTYQGDDKFFKRGTAAVLALAAIYARRSRPWIFAKMLSHGPAPLLEMTSCNVSRATATACKALHTAWLLAQARPSHFLSSTPLEILLHIMSFVNCERAPRSVERTCKILCNSQRGWEDEMAFLKANDYFNRSIFLPIADQHALRDVLTRASAEHTVQIKKTKQIFEMLPTYNPKWYDYTIELRSVPPQFVNNHQYGEEMIASMTWRMRQRDVLGEMQQADRALAFGRWKRATTKLFLIVKKDASTFETTGDIEIYYPAAPTPSTNYVRKRNRTDKTATKTFAALREDALIVDIDDASVAAWKLEAQQASGVVKRLKRGEGKMSLVLRVTDATSVWHKSLKQIVTVPAAGDTASITALALRWHSK